MALLYHIVPNRALFSGIYFGVLCYGACVSIKSVLYSSSLPLCVSSIPDLPVAVPAGVPKRYFINAENFLAKNHRYKPGGLKKNNYLYDCG